MRFWRTPYRPGSGRLRRLAGGVILIPAILLGGAGGAYYYKLHRITNALTLSGLPVAAPTGPARRILVLSPHCDDETLGVGSLISEARESGAEVTVAFLTNGDGFRMAASRSLHLHIVDVGPSDFVRFAELRQNEAVAALKELGVPEDHVEFFGYPDRGLRPMWETNWEPGNPFRSGFTGHTHVPYKRAYSPQAPYCGASLAADLKRLMEKTRPTDILVTHPSDDHPDHNAAPAFAQEALRECVANGDVWAGKAHVRFYIVHRGDWPLPQGYHPTQPLTPPPGLLTRDTRWNVYPAGHLAKAAKDRALDHYVSQTNVAGRFLWSFVRTNELLADLPTPFVSKVASAEFPAAEVASGAGVMAGAPSASCETASDGPYGDSLVRYVEPAADLTGLGVALIGDSVRIRLTTRGAASRNLQYRLMLRGSETGPDGKTETRFTSETMVVLPVSAKRGGHTIETDIPLDRVGLAGPGRERRLWVAGESRWSNSLPLIDRTGYRLFLLGDSTRTDSISVKITAVRAPKLFKTADAAH